MHEYFTVGQRNRMRALFATGGVRNSFVENPIGMSITGPATLCSSATYTLTNLPIGATVVWTATGSISISGANNINPIEVIKNSDGIGSLTATIATVCGDVEMVKNGIQVGLPVNPSFSFHPSPPIVPMNMSI